MNIEVPNLKQETLDLLNQIPKGKVSTYREIAAALGDVTASRAVGQIVSEFTPWEEFPTHRVIYVDGTINNIVSGDSTNSEILKSEDIPIAGLKVQDFQKYFWNDFSTNNPLAKLRLHQQKIATLVKTESNSDNFRTAGGVDLSYESPWHGVGAYVHMDIESNSVLNIELEHQEISFPYIPTYLAYRELPVHLALLKRIQDSSKLADIIFVDGSGILHPRHVGVASQLGVLLDVPTIGVTKKKLYGSVAIAGMREGDVRMIIDPEDAREIGAAIKTRERAEPIYVSVGHGLNLAKAIELVLKMSRNKLPEPIHRADRASREAAGANKENLKQKAFDL
jgi:deoxyribonuclease V